MRDGRWELSKQDGNQRVGGYARSGRVYGLVVCGRLTQGGTVVG